MDKVNEKETRVTRKLMESVIRIEEVIKYITHTFMRSVQKVSDYIISQGK
jgi:hypothetical protein